MSSAHFKSNSVGVQNDSVYSIGLTERTLLHIDSDESTMELYSSLNYNINFNRVGRVTLKSSVGYQKSSFYKRAIDQYTGIPDYALSGDESSSSTMIREGIEYAFTKGRHSITASLSYQGIFIRRDERFPDVDARQKRFYAFIPEVTYLIGQYTPKQWQIYLSMREETFPLAFLSARLDATNPVYLKTGNPDLKSPRKYDFGLLRFVFDDKKTCQLKLFAYLYCNKIINNRIYFANPTILSDYGNYEVPAGATLMLPVNADRSIEISPSIEYKTQLLSIKSIFNIKAEYRYGNPQEGVNNTLVRTYQHSGNVAMSLTSNFSREFRAELRNITQYRRFENSLKNVDENWSEAAGVNFRWDFLERAYLTGLYTFEYLENTYSDAIENHILNASVGCRVFKNRKGTISFNAYDIFDRTANFITTASNQLVNNQYKQLSSSFFSIAFEYKFNNTK